jgi:hypothetical protein
VRRLTAPDDARVTKLQELARLAFTCPPPGVDK